MTEEFSASAKVYPTAEHDKLSILDMLDYFEKHGAIVENAMVYPNGTFDLTDDVEDMLKKTILEFKKIFAKDKGTMEFIEEGEQE